MCFPEVSFGACVLLILLLLTVPLPWVAAAILAAGFHEACHVLALFTLGEKIEGFSLSGLGARLDLRPLPPWKELLAAAAGPAGSLFLGLFLHVFPRLSLCGLCQGLFNLLPVLPLDGGRILKCGLELFLKEEKAEKICRILQVTFLVFLLILAISRKSLFGLILVLSLIFRIFQ